MNEPQRIFQVNGEPFFPVGGQTHNSSGYGAAELERVWPALAAIDANSVAVPVYWEQVEPQEGVYDWSPVDAVIDGARAHGYRVVLLWFASWKNGKSRYCPVWVKRDAARFARVHTPDGQPLAILSPHCPATWEADRRAFCGLMGHLSAKDATEHTVLAVQIENEPGFYGSDRDYGPLGQAVYEGPVPAEVLHGVRQHPDSPITASWQAQGAPAGSWEACFGQQGGEYLSAWAIARYIDGLAEAGKAVYPLPLYANVWLGQRGYYPAGSYPSGGAIAQVLDLWKWLTPHIDLIAPDIYTNVLRDYRAACAAYARNDNPLYIPESAWQGPNALYMFAAVADYGAIGLHIFGVESILDSCGQVRPENREVVASLKCLSAAALLLVRYQGTGRLHAVLQEEYQAEQTLDLGDYWGLVRFASADEPHFRDREHLWVSDAPRGRGLVVQAEPDTFFLVGSGYRLILRKKAAPSAMLSATSMQLGYLTRLTSYAALEEGRFVAGQWVVSRRRNGDEADFGIWVTPDVGIVRAVVID
jgi:hypothetical protein